MKREDVEKFLNYLNDQIKVLKTHKFEYCENNTYYFVLIYNKLPNECPYMFFRFNYNENFDVGSVYKTIMNDEKLKTLAFVMGLNNE
ncbi:MAG: hypothetical protein QG564_1810 [Campylobacterota bacterium]|nr:hypothetical protein [Campylobacterota bacterium]